MWGLMAHQASTPLCADNHRYLQVKMAEEELQHAWRITGNAKNKDVGEGSEKHGESQCPDAHLRNDII